MSSVTLNINPTDPEFLEFYEAVIDAVPGDSISDQTMAYFIMVVVITVMTSGGRTEEELREVFEMYTDQIWSKLASAYTPFSDDEIGDVANSRAI